MYTPTFDYKNILFWQNCHRNRVPINNQSNYTTEIYNIFTSIVSHQNYS